MIKKLRMKFVAVNMAIATAMLCVILGMVYSFTSSGLEREMPEYDVQYCLPPNWSWHAGYSG